MEISPIDEICTNQTHYYGKWLSPRKRGQASSFMYIKNGDNDSIYIFLLNPGFFDDVYQLISDPSILNVYIFPVSIDALYISDLVRLQEIAELKGHFKIYFPESLEEVAYTSQKMLSHYVRTNEFILNLGVNSIVCKFLRADTLSNYYDLLVDDGIKSYLITPYLTKEKLTSLNSDKNITEIHVNYFYQICKTGLSFRECMMDSELCQISKKVKPVGYSTSLEYEEMLSLYPDSIIPTVY